MTAEEDQAVLELVRSIKTAPPTPDTNFRIQIHELRQTALSEAQIAAEEKPVRGSQYLTPNAAYIAELKAATQPDEVWQLSDEAYTVLKHRPDAPPPSDGLDY